MLHRFLMLLVVTWSVVSASAQVGQTVGRHVYPYVRVGLAVMLPESSSNDGTHTGFMVGGGLRVPLDSMEYFSVQAELQYVSKGMQDDILHAHRTIRADANYLALPLSLCYNFCPEKSFSFSVGAGLYGAYGVGGSIEAADGIYFYEGFPVDGHRSTFTVGNFPRWDVGGQIVSILKYKHVLFSYEVACSFLKRNRLGSQHKSCNISGFTMGFGYEF
ncbi:MAG: outer membrane beta-barrel protein [Prevotella sp.]|nr:outer membrane beta-barrel protein [Prevotella sp.]